MIANEGTQATADTATVTTDTTAAQGAVGTEIAPKDTTATTVLPATEVKDASPVTGYAAWGALIVALLVAAYAWKQIADLGAKISALLTRVKALEDERDKMKERLTDDAYRLNALQTDVRELKERPVYVPPTASQPDVFTGGGHAEAEPEKPQAEMVTRYANLQAPDSSGTLRFSSRGMIDKATSAKMFMLRLDEESGLGTYHINPQGIPLIKNDLQMLREFVKPFTFIGDVDTAKIDEMTAGSVKRSGDFWIVTELLEINIE